MSIITADSKTAIVLFNLGGPDSLEAVQPFLFNLFNDPAIIRVPSVLRTFLAKKISRKRAPVAQNIYKELGNRSPILPNTQAQADALKALLSAHGQVECFIAMRYWHPMSDETAQAVKQYAPDHIILLTLYPQYSTTTTASSLKDWQRAAHAIGLHVPTSAVCCYPQMDGFVTAQAELIAPALTGNERLLFSAHGLPEKIVKAGDPYQKQVEQTTQEILRKLGGSHDYVNCYQSRVGPLKWIGPSTEDEIRRAGADGKDIILIPLAFVSEHSETLVELDIEYKHLADEEGVKRYIRIPTVSTHPAFINGLAQLCLSVNRDGIFCSQKETSPCASGLSGCAHVAKVAA